MHSDAKKHTVDAIPVHLHGITHDLKPKKCKIFYDNTNTAWPPAYPRGYREVASSSSMNPFCSLKTIPATIKALQTENKLGDTSGLPNENNVVL